MYTEEFSPVNTFLRPTGASGFFVSNLHGKKNHPLQLRMVFTLKIGLWLDS